MNIRKSIKIAMASKDVNQFELAKGIGVVPSQISKWINKGGITVKGLESLAAYFDMSVSEFIKLGE